MTSVLRKHKREVKACLWLLLSLLVTLGLTLVLEEGVIGRIIVADRPTIVQFYHNNLPTTSVNLTLGENLIVPVSVSSDNLTFLTSLRIFVSNQTVISASWETLGRDVEIHGLTIGQSQLSILGSAYGISYVPLAVLQVSVDE
jgi:hypothetical protein